MVIYLDASSIEDVEKWIHRVEGVTTNPSLMKKAGVTNYREFASSVIERVEGKCVSFEVTAADEQGMYEQAKEICSWGANVYAKVPVLTAGGSFPMVLLRKLRNEHCRLNVTAVMTRKQIDMVGEILGYRHIVSIFAGRIADTGVDPEPLFSQPRQCKFLWASVRQVYDVVRAERCGADIITLPPSILEKMDLKDKDLLDYSHETSQQFFADGKEIAW